MTSTTVFKRSRTNTDETITAKKITELKARYGLLFREQWDSGRIPISEIGNFFGRANPRQRHILTAMKRRGTSFSQAYKASKDQFDTKNWDKVSNRTATARGHLLKTTARICRFSNPDSFSDDEVETLRTMALQLGQEAVEVSRQVLRCDLRESSESTNGKYKKCRKQKTITEAAPNQFREACSQLATAITKLKKTSRDIPLMLEQLGELQSVRLAASTLVEVGRIVKGATLFNSALKLSASRMRDPVGHHSRIEELGVGQEYAEALAGLSLHDGSSLRIATHREPDADALTAAWIAECHLFPKKNSQIEFIGRTLANKVENKFDCVVDVGQVFDSTRLIFDHKPPAFADRNQTCAAKLIWEHVRGLRRPVNHLAELVELVHDGDAVTRRPRSSRYPQSRRTGFHALIRYAKSFCQNDQMLYQSIKVCLDSLNADSVSPWVCAES